MIIELKISIELSWLFDLVLLFIFRWSCFFDQNIFWHVYCSGEYGDRKLASICFRYMPPVCIVNVNGQSRKVESSKYVKSSSCYMLNHSCLITTLGQPVRSRHLCLKSFWWLKSGKVQTLSGSVLQKAHHFEDEDEHD